MFRENKNISVVDKIETKEVASTKISDYEQLKKKYSIQRNLMANLCERNKYNEALAHGVGALGTCAIMMVNTTLNEEEKAVNYSNLIMTYDYLANINFHLKKYEEAIEYHTISISLCKNAFSELRWYYILRRAKCYLQLNPIPFDKVKDDFNAAMTHPDFMKTENPSLHQMHMELIDAVSKTLESSLTLLNEQKEYDIAGEFGDIYLKFSKNPTKKAYIQILMAYRESKREEDGLTLVNKLLILDPHYEGYYLQRSLLYKALELNPKYKNALELAHKDLLISESYLPLSVEMKELKKQLKDSIQKKQLDQAERKFAIQQKNIKSETMKPLPPQIVSTQITQATVQVTKENESLKKAIKEKKSEKLKIRQDKEKNKERQREHEREIKLNKFCQEIILDILDKAMHEVKVKNQEKASALRKKGLLEKIITPKQLEFLIKLNQLCIKNDATLVIYGSTDIAYELTSLGQEHDLLPHDVDIQIKNIKAINREKIFAGIEELKFIKQPNPLYTQFKTKVDDKDIELTLAIDEYKTIYEPNIIARSQLFFNEKNELVFDVKESPIATALKSKFYRVDLKKDKDIAKARYILARMIKIFRSVKPFLGMIVSIPKKPDFVMDEKWDHLGWRSWLNHFFTKGFKDEVSEKICYREMDKLVQLNFLLSVEAHNMVYAFSYHFIKKKFKETAVGTENMVKLIREFYSKYTASIESIVQGIFQLLKNKPVLQDHVMTDEEFKQCSQSLSLLAETQLVSSVSMFSCSSMEVSSNGDFSLKKQFMQSGRS